MVETVFLMDHSSLTKNQDPSSSIKTHQAARKTWCQRRQGRQSGWRGERGAISRHLRMASGDDWSVVAGGCGGGGGDGRGADHIYNNNNWISRSISHANTLFGGGTFGGTSNEPFYSPSTINCQARKGSFLSSSFDQPMTPAFEFQNQKSILRFC